MPLLNGTRLGPYEVLSPLGAGGMGEVYRARDTRLGREVAIKVLPSHLSDNPELKARFDREARAISQLTHPHICTLYDVGSENGVDFLVMELLEGQSLADRLEKGPLPADQVPRFGVEIADALDRAHRAGIVHRDLKPGNIMLTKSGVKLLDFGLAKVAAAAESPSGLSSFPTQAAAHPLTEKGTIMGTFQYMAPEQLEGKDADARTDIFSFGCVLYEMATGKKAFTGATQASLVSAILRDEPKPISAVSPLAPPALERMVRNCLAKDPEDRWQSARDARNELVWIAQAGSQAGAPAPVVARRKNRERLAWGIAVVAIVLTIAAFTAALRYARLAARPESTIRSSIVLPEKSAVRAAALSPDGKRIVCVARDSSGKNLLWIRPLDSLSLQPLPGTENPSFPFWSPDGRSIGFFADGKLKRIEASGGPPQTLCDAPVSRGGGWSREGVIVFAPVADGALHRVSASGGPSTALTRLDPSRGESSHRWPFFLPDGRHYIYHVANFGSGGQPDKMGTYVRSLDSQEEKFLQQANSSVAYAPSAAGASEGYLLFLRDRNLMAQPFDAQRVRLVGDPLPVAEEIQYIPQTHGAFFSVSNNGVLLYQTRSTSGVSQLAWFDRSGKQTGSLGEPANQANPRISPDGKRVALDIVDPQTGNTDVWIYESSGGIPTRFTSDPAIDNQAVWSPDGSRIAFESLRQSHADLYLKRSSGAGSEEALLLSERSKYPADWSPDGRFILYRAFDSTSNLELWVLPTGGDRKPIPFLKTKFGVSHGQFSPDGRRVAYASNESGRWEIFVAPFPGPGGNWKVSSAGGSEPRWRRDGRELFYLAPDGILMSVDVKEGTGFDADVAKPLFHTRLRQHVSSGDTFSYDVSPDGQRFLMNTDVGEVTSPPLTIVLNWMADLKK